MAKIILKKLAKRSCWDSQQKSSLIQTTSLRIPAVFWRNSRKFNELHKAILNW